MCHLKISEFNSRQWSGKCFDLFVGGGRRTKRTTIVRCKFNKQCNIIERAMGAWSCCIPMYKLPNGILAGPAETSLPVGFKFQTWLKKVEFSSLSFLQITHSISIRTGHVVIFSVLTVQNIGQLCRTNVCLHPSACVVHAII